MKKYLNVKLILLIVAVIFGGVVSAQTYCTPTFSYEDDTYIDEFNLGDINNTSTGGANAYNDYTAQSTEVELGETYDITYRIDGNTYYNQPFAIYIDFNDDGDFEDSGEDIVAVSNEYGNGTLRTVQFTVPLTATTGDTRIRVITNYGGIDGPCLSGNWGEAEDYTLTIKPNVPVPVTGFSADNLRPDNDDEVTFTDSSSNTPTSWAWTFIPNTIAYVTGDSTSQNPVVTFTIPGNYTVKLSATNEGGTDEVTKTNYITVTEAIVTPVTAFSANDTTVKVGDEVGFTDASINDPSNWKWVITPAYYNYIVGNDSAPNISVSFDSLGDYTVTLIASNEAGEDTLIKTDYVSVSAPDKPTAFFTASPTSVYTYDTVALTDKSYNGPTSWLWSFSPNNVEYVTGSSTSQNPVVRFTTAGTYSVNLDATNLGGTGSLEYVEYITVSNPPSPVAAFEANDTTTYVDTTITFTDLTTNNPNFWEWSFNPGSISYTNGTANSQNPQVKFNAAGAYEVTLVAANTSDTDTVTKVSYINVELEPLAPSPEFSADSTDVETGDFVTFTDLSGNDPTSWTWIFDPSTVTYETGTSSSQNPIVSFDEEGTYTVTLIASNHIGSKAKAKADYITVTQAEVIAYAPVAAFSASATSGNIGDSFTFTDTSTNTPTSWSWSFSPNTVTYETGTASSQNPVVSFDAAGTYAVTLTATNATGSDDEVKTDYITITEPDNGGGTTYDTTTVIDTNCAELFNFALPGYIVNDADQAKGFDIVASDEDGLAVHDNLAGWQSGFNVLIENVVGTDTSFMGAFPAWFNDGGTADDYLTFGPLTIGAAGGTLNWKHFYADNTGRNGYEVLVGTQGTSAADFSGSTAIKTFTDNGSSTDGDTTWQNQTADLANYAGQEIYIAFHHNAADMFLLFLDDITVEGCDTTVTVTIDSTVTGGSTGDAPVAAFSASATSGNIGDSFTFTDTSTNTPTSWSWSFSPNTVTYETGTASSQNPVVSFDAAGTYAVTLTATNATGSDDEVKTAYITITDSSVPTNDPPVADFVADKTTAAIGEDVTFTDLSTNTPTQWSWSISPNAVTYSTGTSMSQNPVIQFNAAGTYSVTLTAINNYGADSEIKTSYIVITEDGGGTTTVIDTVCTTILDFPLLGYTVNATDEANFGVNVEDVDGQAVHDNLQGWSSNWNVLIESINGTDTSFMWGLPAWFKDGTNPADDWLTFGPLTIGENGGSVNWKHYFADNTGRNGYEVLVGTAGLASTDFASAETIYSVTDNDASTDGDTSWAVQTAPIASSYAGQEVYIAIHHNAAAAFLLLMDDISVESCDTTVTVVDNGTSTDLEEIYNETELNIYPNPSEGQFTIRYENSEAVTIQVEVLNSVGQLVHSEMIEDFDGAYKQQLDVTEYSKGIYYVKVSSGTFTEIGKVIVF